MNAQQFRTAICAIGLGLTMSAMASPASDLLGTPTVSAGADHVSALRLGGAMFSWGDNSNSQLGDQSSTDRTTPVYIPSSKWLWLDGGANHNLAIKSDSTLWVWGDNAYGQLGNGTTSSVSKPTQVGTSKWIWTSAGQNFGFGIQADSTLWGWGLNDQNQLGDGSGTNQQTPVQIGSDQWLWVSAGTSHALAIMSDNTLWAWGANNKGQLGVKSFVSKITPTKVGASNWSSVSAGDSISAGIKSDGTLWTWGKNDVGQLGLGSLVDTNGPAQVGSATWKYVSAGSTHMLAVKNDGTLWAWGKNNQGQLGDGSTTNRNAPVQIGSATWLWVSAGALHSVGMQADSTIWVWGDNSNGQLGDSTTTRQLAPQKVTKYPKMTQVITFAKPNDTIYGTSGLTLGATSTSGLTVTYTSGTPSVCSVSGAALTLNAIGSCTINALQTGDANYLAASQVQQTFSISKKTITVTGLSASNKTYDNSLNATLSGTAALSGVVGSDVVALDATNAAFKFANKNVGNAKSITVTGYSISGANAGNYTLVQPSGFSANITTRPITITANAQTKVYGDNDPTLDWTLSSGSWATGENAGSVVTGILTRVSGETKGKYAIGLGSVVVNSNYALTFVGDTLSITPRPITITADQKSKIYGATDPSFTFTTSEDPSVISGFLFRDTASQAVGKYAILGDSLVVDSNYSPVTYVADSLEIKPKALAVTASDTSKLYGAADPTFVWTATGYEYTDDSTDVSGSLSRAIGENVGKYALTVGSLASSNYTINFTPDTLTIVPETLTVTAAAKTKKYGNVDPFLLYTATGFITGEDEGLLYGVLKRDTGKTIGKYEIKVGTLSAGNNYVINYVPDSLQILPRTITVKAAAKTKVYGVVDPSFTYTATGYATGDNSSIFTGALERTDTSSGVGKYEISQGTLVADSNYTVTFQVESLTVTPKALALAVNPVAITYGDAEPSFTFAGASGLVNGDDSATVITGALYRDTTQHGVGKYVIHGDLLSAGSNYTLTVTDDTLTINPAALTITADAKTKVYGSADPILTWTASGFVNTEDSTVVSGSLVRHVGRNVGKYAITQGSLSSPNYAITYAGDSLEITQKALTITAVRKTKVYGSVDPTLTWVGVGFASGENSSSINGVLYRDSGNAVGAYEIKGDSLTNSNYNITFNSDSLVVTPKTLNVKADSFTVVYGSADPTFTWHATGYAYSDDSTVVSGSLYRDTSLHGVGKYPIKGDSLNPGSNYTIAFTTDTLRVTPKNLIVTANPRTKVYGDADPTLDYVADSLVGSDTLQGVLSRESGNNVGHYLIKKGSLNAGSNYHMTYVADTLKITKKSIAIQADSITRVYGAIDPALTWTLSSGAFAYSDDQSAFSGALARDTGATVGSYVIRIGTLANGNYDFSYTADTFRITQRPLTITANRVSKIYGNNDPTLTWSAVGYAPGEGAGQISGLLSRSAGESVGTYGIAMGTLTNSNYDITYVGDSLQINTRPLTIKADAKTKAFGTTDPSLTWKITSGTIASRDSLGIITGSLTRVAGSSVKKYAINQGSLAITSDYDLTYVLDSLEITKAQQIINFANISSKIYGDSVTLNATTGSGLTIAFNILDTNVCKLNGTIVKTKSKGLCEVVAKQAGDSGYFAADSVKRAFAVQRKNVVLMPNSLTKVYGLSDDSLSFTYRSVGLVYGDSLHGELERDTGEIVGAYKIKMGTFADSTTDTNYVYTFDTTAKLTITPKAMVITAAAKTMVYGDTEPSLTWSATGYANGDDSTDLTGSLTRKVGVNVGSYPISQGTLKATANYAVTFVPDTLKITKRALTVTAAAKTKVYGATDPILTWTGSGYKSGETATVVTGALSRDTGKAIGKYAILQGTLASSNYVITYVGDSLSITAKPLTVKAVAKSKVYGSADVALTYTATGLNTGDVLSGNLTRVAGDTVGKYLIQQGTIANSNYTITYTPDTFKVTPKAVTVRADSASKIFGESDPSLTYKVTGLIGSDTLVGTLTRATGDSVATYVVSRGSLLDASNPNYTITYFPANFKIKAKPITVKADSAFKYFGTPDSKLSLVYQVTGLNGSDTLTGKLSRVAGESIGRYAITQGTLANPNYAITFVGDSLRIGKKDVLVVADVKTKVYGSVDPVLTYKSVGLAKGEVLKGALDRVAGERVGKYAITHGTLSELNPNHNISFVGDSITVTAKPVTVTATPKSKTYGDADPTLAYTSVGLVGTDAFAGALTRDTGSSAGVYAIKKGTLVNKNYAITFVGSNLTINKKALVVKADTGLSKTYGNADPSLTWKATGYVNGDDSADIGGSLQRAVGANVGKYPITVGTLANKNYAITFTGANFAVKPRALAVSVNPVTKVYGALEPVLSWTATGYAPGENASKITGNLVRVAGTAVGKYAISKGSLANPNYTITIASSPESLSITRKPITVTASPTSKVYGGVDPSLTYKAVGLVGSDLLKGVLKRDTGKVVGAYLINQGTLNDSANVNYSISFVADSFRIAKKILTVTATAQIKKYKEADPTFGYKTTGLVIGDVLTGALSRDTGSNVGVYAIRKGTLDNSNYAITLVPSQLTIAPKPITVKSDSIYKAKNTVDPKITYTVLNSGLESGDSLLGAVSRVKGELEGKYRTTIGTLKNPNYLITFQASNFVIGPDTANMLARHDVESEIPAQQIQNLNWNMGTDLFAQVQGYTEIFDIKGNLIWSGFVADAKTWIVPFQMSRGIYWLKNSSSGKIAFAIR